MPFWSMYWASVSCAAEHLFKLICIIFRELPVSDSSEGEHLSESVDEGAWSMGCGGEDDAASMGVEAARVGVWACDVAMACRAGCAESDEFITLRGVDVEFSFTDVEVWIFCTDDGG